MDFEIKHIGLNSKKGKHMGDKPTFILFASHHLKRPYLLV
jgi:hypothetical protein